VYELYRYQNARYNNKRKIKIVVDCQKHNGMTFIKLCMFDLHPVSLARCRLVYVSSLCACSSVGFYSSTAVK